MLTLHDLRRPASKALRALARKRDEFVSHRNMNHRAKEKYQAIVAQNADRRVDGKKRQEILDYARTVLGSAVYAPWLLTYTAFRGAFHEGWIPYNYFRRHVSLRKTDPRRAIELKTLSARLLQTDAIPDLVYRINGRFFDKGMNPLNRNDAIERIFRESDDAFLKKDDSRRGQGITRITKGDVSLDALEGWGDFSIQKPVVQHPFFDAFSPKAVATLRLTTVNPNGGGPELRAVYLRLGRSADDLVKSTSAVRVPVDMTSGELSAEGALPDWTRTDRHPDTGTPFAGAVIPAYQKTVQTCLALHARIPHAELAGWDVCVSPDGDPVLFEVNVENPSVDFSEAATGPIFLGLGWDSRHREKLPDRADGPLR